MSWNRSFLDHALVMVGCGMAVYAVSMSLNKPVLAIVATLAVLSSLGAGFALSQFMGRRGWAGVDGYLWTGLALASVFTAWPVNRILPEDGFPFQLIVGGWLCWMVVLCGLVSWRDQTLLFLNIPCLALFGLVGVFDTFPAATLMFFGFLATSTFLYARIHHRSMVERAREAGVEDVELLRHGAWRWMAGPEWALVAAAAIVVFSLLGAPVLQFSVQNVSGAVSVQLPDEPSRREAAAARVTAESLVGRGPASPSNRPVFRVKTGRIGLLRTATYLDYTGSGWNRGRELQGFVSTNGPRRPPTARLFRRIGDRADGRVVGWPDGAPEEGPLTGVLEEFVLAPYDDRINLVAAPGQIRRVDGIRAERVAFRADGTVELRRGVPPGRSLTVWYDVPPSPSAARDAALPRVLQPYWERFLQLETIPPPVAELARRVTEGASTDVERARRLKRFLEGHARYHLLAPATPPDRDPAAFFLLESREGYCDLFATSMTLMARAVGLPARYAVGYAVTDLTRDREGFFTVRERDAHAWAEIYFKDVGWVPFDPTEGAEPVPGGERGATRRPDRPLLDGPLARTLFFVLVGLAAIGAAVALSMGRRTPSLSRANGSETALARTYGHFQRTLERRLGRPRALDETVSEFVEAAAPTLGACRHTARVLAERFSAATYGPEKPTHAQVAALAGAARRFRADLAKVPKVEAVP